MQQLLSFLVIILFFTACDNSPSNNTEDPKPLDPNNLEAALQTKLIQAKAGDIIILPEGSFEIKRQLSFNDGENVTILGAGAKKTILSFKNQVEGAEGLNIKGAKGITLQGFSIHDTKGDAIKVQQSENVTFRDIEVSWTGGALPTNGAYGLYPVNCKNVLMEDCEASYSMDAGIYVGQSENIVVRRCYAHHNVAGIEIENSSNGDIYENKAENNTGGLMIFDMPDIPKANGAKMRVHDNIVLNNNHPNFSAKGIIVNIVPPGTGMLLMAHKEMDVYNNKIEGHKTIGMGITSWLFTGKPYKSKEYDPFCSAIQVYDNSFEKGVEAVDTTTDFGRLMAGLFQGQSKDIVTDGIFNPSHVDEKGFMLKKYSICIRNNGNISFVNLNAGKGSSPAEMMANMTTDPVLFNCEREAVDISGHNDWLSASNEE